MTEVYNRCGVLRTNTAFGNVDREVFNTACSERHTLLDLAAGLEKLLGKQAQPEFAPPRLGEIKHSQAAIDKARSRLGYAPVVSFGQGLERMVGFFESRVVASTSRRKFFPTCHCERAPFASEAIPDYQKKSIAWHIWGLLRRPKAGRLAMTNYGRISASMH